jgi:hypothetical protein
VIGRSCFGNILPHVDGEEKLLCQDGCSLAATILDGQEREMEAFLHHHDGTARAEAPERAQQMEEIAYLDTLTRVGNRRFAELVIADRLSEWKR